MFHDLMLKFADEGEATAALFDEGQPRYTAVDMIGTIYEPAPDPVPEDYVPVPYPGYHVNVRHTAEAPELDDFVVNPTPVTPLRVWA